MQVQFVSKTMLSYSQSRDGDTWQWKNKNNAECVRSKHNESVLLDDQANRDLKIDAFSCAFWILLQRVMHQQHVHLNFCGASMVSGVIDY